MQKVYPNDAGNPVAFIPENVPDALKIRPQWVLWVYEQRDGLWTKNLFKPENRTQASTTDLLTWGSFDEALKAASENEQFDGVGFVFCSADPFCGIDLDSCRNPETGEIDEWAALIVKALDGYTESSPSGRGVHIIVRGKVPKGRRKTRDGRTIEVYSERRFFTITGRVL